MMEKESKHEGENHPGWVLWRPDSEVDCCQLCETKFTLITRRHHCRSCGDIFCDACSSHKLPVFSSTRKSRVCHTCFDLRTGNSSDLSAPLYSSRLEPSSSTTSPSSQTQQLLSQQQPRDRLVASDPALPYSSSHSSSSSSCSSSSPSDLKSWNSSPLLQHAEPPPQEEARREGGGGSGILLPRGGGPAPRPRGLTGSKIHAPILIGVPGGAVASNTEQASILKEIAKKRENNVRLRNGNDGPCASPLVEPLRDVEQTKKALREEEEPEWLKKQAKKLKEQKKHNMTRKQVVDELLATERTYVQGLQAVVTEIVRPMKRSSLSGAELGGVFLNIEEILSHHQRFLPILQERVKGWNSDSVIGDIFIKHMNFLSSAYEPYLRDFDINRVQLLEGREDFKQLRTNFEAKHNNKLESFLILPVQRIPRYILLLKEMCRFTESLACHTDYQQVRTALSTMENTMGCLNRKIDKRKTIAIPKGQTPLSP
ncbi:Rho guanine nucleotide exchange factor (GEF) 17 [Balamuthia mandrillaris]